MVYAFQFESRHIKHLNMKLLFQLLAALLFIVSKQLPAQNVGEIFAGGQNDDVVHHLLKASDGMIYAIGAKKTTPKQFKLWLQQLDPEGKEVMWEKLYPISGIGRSDIGFNISQTPDGGFMVTGTSASDTLSTLISYALAMKTDAQGNMEWKKYYTVSRAAYGSMPGPNNGYYLGGYNRQGSGGNGILWYINQNGDLQWSKAFSNYSRTRLYQLYPAGNNAMVVVGRTATQGSGFAGVLVLKLAADGTEIWRREHDTGLEYENGNYEEAFQIPQGSIRMDDGGFLITNPGKDITLLRLDNQGNLMWKRQYEWQWKKKALPLSLCLLPDNSAVICGFTPAVNHYEPDHGFAMRVDVDLGGREHWRKEFDAPNNNNRLACCLALKKGHVLFGGWNNSPKGHGAFDGWIVRTGASGSYAPWKIEGQIMYDLNGNCQPDPGEPGASGLKLEASGDTEGLIVSKHDGTFSLNTNSGTTNFTFLDDDPNWKLCSNSMSVMTDSTQPLGKLVLILSHTDKCAHVEVGITHPLLVRCQPAKYFISVRNNGAVAWKNGFVHVDIDSALMVTAVSNGGMIETGRVVFPVIDLAPAGLKTFEITAQLSCHVQLGAIHIAKASIYPIDCYKSCNGPHLMVEGRCEAGQVIFKIENDGTDMNASTLYRVFCDNYLYIEAPIQIGTGSYSEVSFPALGKTWHLEVDPPAGSPEWSHPAYTLEACGLGGNGMHAVGFGNDWRFDEDAQHISTAVVANTTGELNDITEAVSGFGSGRYHDDSRELEFTAHFRNPLQKTAQKAEFVLNPNRLFDVKSFKVIASNRPVDISISANNTIVLKMDSLNLTDAAVDPANADAFVRFRIKPKDLKYPVLDIDSALMSISGSASCDGFGPINLHQAWYHYKKEIMAPDDPLYNYQAGISTIGGRNWDVFGDMAASPNGNVFCVNSSNSFEGGYTWDGIIHCIDANGKFIWHQFLALGQDYTELFEKVLALPDGSCIAAGVCRDPDTRNYLEFNDVLVARFSATGELLWYKRLRPGLDDGGGWSTCLERTHDGNFVIGGYNENGPNDTDNFLIKMSPDGDVFWMKTYFKPGIIFQPKTIHATSDGGFLLVGKDTGPGKLEVFIQKVDSSGAELWAKGHNTVRGYEIGGSVLQPDEGFIAGGYSWWFDSLSNQNVTGPNFMRFDANGLAVWEKPAIFGPNKVSYVYNITPGLDGEIYAVGKVSIDYTTQIWDMMFIRVNGSGDIINYNSYGNGFAESALAAVATKNEAIFIWGYHTWYSDSDENMQNILVKVDKKGKLEKPMVKYRQSDQPWYAVNIYPNPVSEICNIQMFPNKLGNYHWQLNSMNGKQIRSGISTEAVFSVPVRGLANGMYIIQIAGPDGHTVARKIMVSRAD